MTNTHSKPAYDNNGRKLSDGPILPLIDEDDGSEIDDTRASTFKLRTAPADADSPKYSFKVAIIDSKSTPRQAIKWITRMEKVFAGLNMTNATAKPNGWAWRGDRLQRCVAQYRPPQTNAEPPARGAMTAAAPGGSTSRCATQKTA